MYCNNCGANIDDNSRFCLHCGQQISGTNSDSNMNNNDSNMNENQYQGYANDNQQYSNQPNGNMNNKPQYINTLSYDPISMWGYFGYELLFAIPVVGLILMIIFSFTSNNVNVRNFSRAYLIVNILGWVLAFFICASLGVSIFNIFNGYRY